jgi:hypothetical protein
VIAGTGAHKFPRKYVNSEYIRYDNDQCSFRYCHGLNANFFVSTCSICKQKILGWLCLIGYNDLSSYTKPGHSSLEVFFEQYVDQNSGLIRNAIIKNYKAITGGIHSDESLSIQATGKYNEYNQTYYCQTGSLEPINIEFDDYDNEIHRYYAAAFFYFKSIEDFASGKWIKLNCDDLTNSVHGYSESCYALTTASSWHNLTNYSNIALGSICYDTYTHGIFTCGLQEYWKDIVEDFY